MRTADQTIKDFCTQLAAGTPAPGGGAAAAVAAALGGAVASMAAGLTAGRDKYASVHDEMVDLQAKGVREMEALLACADEDQAAFNQVMAAFALPKGTDEEKAERQQAVQAGFRRATESPLNTMEHSLAVMRLTLAAATRGNPNALSDAYVGYLTASAAFEAGLWNVAINLGSLKDETFKQQVLEKVNRLRSERDEVVAAFRELTPEPVVRFLERK